MHVEVVGLAEGVEGTGLVTKLSLSAQASGSTSAALRFQKLHLPLTSFVQSRFVLEAYVSFHSNEY